MSFVLMSLSQPTSVRPCYRLLGRVEGLVGSGHLDLVFLPYGWGFTFLGAGGYLGFFLSCSCFPFSDYGRSTT